MSYKTEAREFLERSGVDPDIFDWDIAEIMADFAHVKVGESTSRVKCSVCPGGYSNGDCGHGAGW